MKKIIASLKERKKERKKETNKQTNKKGKISDYFEKR